MGVEPTISHVMSVEWYIRSTPPQTLQRAFLKFEGDVDSRIDFRIQSVRTFPMPSPMASLYYLTTFLMDRCQTTYIHCRQSIFASMSWITIASLSGMSLFLDDRPSASRCVNRHRVISIDQIRKMSSGLSFLWIFLVENADKRIVSNVLKYVFARNITFRFILAINRFGHSNAK